MHICMSDDIRDTCMHKYMCAYIQDTCIHEDIHTYIHVCMCIHTYTCVSSGLQRQLCLYGGEHTRTDPKPSTTLQPERRKGSWASFRF